MQDPNAGPQGPGFQDPNVPQKPIPGGSDKDAIQMAMLSHLLGVLSGFIGPLIIYFVKKDDHPFIEQEAKEAVNFHLTMLIWYFASIVIVTASCGVIFFAPLVPAVISVIFGVIATVESNKGSPYRYPMTIRFIS